MKTILTICALIGGINLAMAQESIYVYVPSEDRTYEGSMLEEGLPGEYFLADGELVGEGDLTSATDRKDYMGKMIRNYVAAGGINISCDKTVNVICFRTPEPDPDPDEEEDGNRGLIYIYDGQHTVVECDVITPDGNDILASGNVKFSTNPELGAQLEAAEAAWPFFRWKVYVGTFNQVTEFGEGEYRIECINSPDNCVYIYMPID